MNLDVSKAELRLIQDVLAKERHRITSDAIMFDLDLLTFPHYENMSKRRKVIVALLERIESLKNGKPVEAVPETRKRDDPKQTRMF